MSNVEQEQKAAEKVAEKAGEKVGEQQSTSGRGWLGRAFKECFQDEQSERVIDEIPEITRRRRVIDLSFSPGRISARLNGEEDKSFRVDLALLCYDEQQWQKIVAVLSSDALFLSMYLAGEFPSEINHNLAAIDLPLAPIPSEFKLMVNGEPQRELTKESALVVLRVADRLEEDPGLIFLLRGKQREEVLHDLYAVRRRVKAVSRAATAASAPAVNADSAQVETPEPDNRPFWEVPKEIFSLRYELRSDELPASVLKRLDHIPLDEAVEGVDRLLEQAYAQAAIRAQGYAITLERE